MPKISRVSSLKEKFSNMYPSRVVFPFVIFLFLKSAWYPENPTSLDRTQMASFIESLATFYPCIYCAEDFQENIKKTPVRTESREQLCLWICEQHNIVNRKLGKPTFPCTIERLDSRWKKNDRCQSGTD
mmetsp:Transcript_15941/g.22707  ORF Transcript_15941/g.22707 Transcript_15941/m.22707 type:complete len:129 (-) Transcript_15941:191-577(-)